MANCPRCGREVPFYSLREICGSCRASMAHFAAEQGEPAPFSRLAEAEAWPPVTTFLLVMNFIVFLAMIFSGISPLGPSTEQLLRWGGNWAPLALFQQPWRLLTANYVHIGIIHIALNMWCLWNLGGLAERIFDRWIYFVIYTCCGLAGSLLSDWTNPIAPNAGASGAIFGIAGALISALYMGRLPLAKHAVQSTLRSLLIFAGFNLLYGARSAHISNSSHIGGLVMGLAMGAILAQTLHAPASVRRIWGIGVGAAAVAVLFGGFNFARRSQGYVLPLAQGTQSLGQGRNDQAIRYLEAAVAARPNNHNALALLGNAYVQDQQYQKAEGVLTRAVQIDPRDQDSQFYLGYSQLKLGRNRQAVETLEKAVLMNPKDADAEETLGQAYQAVGSQSAADVAFRRAAELRKASPNN